MSLRAHALVAGCVVIVTTLTYVLKPEYDRLVLLTLVLLWATASLVGWLLDCIAWHLGEDKIDTDHKRRRY